MKKIIYLFMVIGLITACNPMDDIYNDIDSQVEVITGDVEYTLTDEDYDDLDLGFGSFNSIDDAKSMIPGLLSDKYPVWGEGSLADVTFNLYKSNSIKNEVEYEVSDDDYATLGFNFGNFSKSSDMVTFLMYKYPNAERGDLVELTYKYWAPGVEVRTNKFIMLDEWELAGEFTPEDYANMEQSFPNFSNEDDAEFRIGIYLETLMPFAMAGDEVTTIYQLFTSGSGVSDELARYSYDGDKWNHIGSVIEESIKFGHDGTTWVPDNTINYTLTSADYNLVGNGNFGNFDVRPGKDEETVEARLAKINTILLNNFAGMAEGQKYVVTYNVWSGAPEVWQMKVILEGGEYILNE